MPSAIKALIVDDSSFMRTRIRLSLDALGVEVQGEAGDVPSGIEAFRAAAPDLVIMDMVMPGGSGLDLLKHVMSEKPDANVIVLTSLDQARLDQEFSRLGARAIVNKPFTDDDIKTALKSVFPDRSFDGPPPAADGSLSVATPASGSARQLEALQEFFRAVPERSAQAMSRWCKATWDLDLVMYRVASKQPLDLILQRLLLSRAVVVEITIQQTVKIIGIALLPLSSVENVAVAVAGKRPESLSQAEVETLMTEWTNVIIADVINLFANKMKTILLSSSPKILKMNAEELLSSVPKTLGEKPENVLAVLCQYSSGAIATSCETLFFLRPDCLPGGGV